MTPTAVFKTCSWTWFILRRVNRSLEKRILSRYRKDVEPFSTLNFLSPITNVFYHVPLLTPLRELSTLLVMTMF